MHNSRSLLCHYSYSHLQLSNHAICANTHPILTTSSSHMLCRHCHVKITIKIVTAFSPESRYTDFTEKYTLEMTSQVIQKRDSFTVLLQLYRLCRSSWALEVHAVLSGLVCIKKYSCCRLWFSGQKSEYQLRDHLWWKRLLLTLMTLWQKRRACNLTHRHELQNNSQLKPTGAPWRWSLITSHQSPMQMSYYAVIVPFTHA